MLCKGTIATGESDKFFGICSSVSLTLRSLASADSPGKFYMLFLPLGSTIFENTRILSGILDWMPVLKHRLNLLEKWKSSYKKNCLVNKPPDVLKQGRRKVFRTEASVLEDFVPPSTFLPKETHRLSTACKIMPSHKARNYS